MRRVGGMKVIILTRGGLPAGRRGEDSRRDKPYRDVGLSRQKSAEVIVPRRRGKD
jgi:hypothetical protein